MVPWWTLPIAFVAGMGFSLGMVFWFFTADFGGGWGH